MEESGQAQIRAENFRQSEINLRTPDDLGERDSLSFSLFRAGLRSSRMYKTRHTEVQHLFMRNSVSYMVIFKV